MNKLFMFILLFQSDPFRSGTNLAAGDVAERMFSMLLSAMPYLFGIFLLSIFGIKFIGNRGVAADDEESKEILPRQVKGELSHQESKPASEVICAYCEGAFKNGLRKCANCGASAKNILGL